jgi:hypothetical protein
VRAVQFHPVKCSGGIQTTRESDANLLADGQMFKNDRHECRRPLGSAYRGPFGHFTLLVVVGRRSKGCPKFMKFLICFKKSSSEP